MFVTIVNDYYSTGRTLEKPDGDISEGKAAVAGLMAHFEKIVP